MCGHYASGPDEWYEALDALLDNAALRRAMGREGRARAVADFDIQAHARRWVEVIREVANS